MFPDVPHSVRARCRQATCAGCYCQTSSRRRGSCHPQRPNSRTHRGGNKLLPQTNGDSMRPTNMLVSIWECEEQKFLSSERTRRQCSTPNRKDAKLEEYASSGGQIEHLTEILITLRGSEHIIGARNDNREVHRASWSLKRRQNISCFCLNLSGLASKGRPHRSFENNLVIILQN